MSLRHFLARGHWPAWLEHGGLRACMRCVRGGHRFRPVPVPW